MPDARELDRGEIGPRPKPTWRQMGACRGLVPNIFYPDDERGEVVAKAICGECVVRLACLEYALTTREPYGVWGGTTEAERRSIIRRRSRTR